jgi:hypothetical protein
VILILSNPGDLHARHIASKLKQRGGRVACISRGDFGKKALLAFRPNVPNGRIALQDGTIIASEDVSAVWFRRPGIVSPDPAITDELDRSFTENEWNQALDGFFTVAFGRQVSPPLKQRAATKLLQLSLASRLGMRVPQTLVTSSAEEAFAFVAEHHGAVVHKAMSAPRHTFIDTRAWDSEATRRAADLAMCPTILQERIFGPMDIRATVIGGQIFSACIHTSQGRAEIDSRLDPDAPFTVYKLPSSVEGALHRLMGELGLVFGTIDLKIATNGEHVFLEINPQGQFLYVEIHTGLPISDALVEYLAKG